MRHVGQKFRFVLRCERQLLGFLLERETRLFDLGILALDLGILLRQQFRLGGQLFVGLLKLTLAGLQLDGQPLRLFEQAFRAHCRLDRLEDGANTSSQLFQEGKVDVVKAVHRCEFDDRFRLALE